LGLHEHRSAKLSNIDARIGGTRRNQTFLNFNLRAISYPKYEISEAGACKLAADSICAGWLSDQYYSSGSSKTSLKEDKTKEEGRNRWNERFKPIWQGTAGAVR